MKILLIGGGTGGHIFPLKNLTDELLEKKAEVHLLVSESDLDKKILNENFDATKVTFHYCKTGKIRRYLSWQNVKDFFQIWKAVFWAHKFLKKHQFDVLFFKGGFVGFPIIVAAKFLFPRFKGKIFSHESDISAGLLTRFASKFSDQIFSNFGNNALPLFFSGEEREKTNTNRQKKNILIFGGSQGAEFINQLFLSCHQALLEKYRVTLISGVEKKIELQHDHFEQFEFLEANVLAQKINASDLIISRGGANSLFEILTQKRLSIIIPLPSAARNHQMKNAQYFEEQNLTRILPQNKSAKHKLVPLISTIFNDKNLQQSLQKSDIKNQAKKIADILMCQ